MLLYRDARREGVDLKQGVIIANTGSPDSPAPADVRSYLQEFLSNPRIAPMNPLLWKAILHRKVLPARTLVSGEKYAHLWDDGAFPLIRDSISLAAMVESSYEQEGRDVAVRAAMSFGNPSIESAMRELREIGCSYLHVLPLYPQNAFSQASIVADAAARFAPETGWGSDFRIIGDYSGNESYLAAVEHAICAAGFGNRGDDRLVMGFHSIPKADVEKGDTYGAAVSATCGRIASDLAISPGAWACAYQCRFDKKRTWLGPFAQDILDQWWAEGFDGRVFYVCPNFSIDCLETRYDVEGVLKTVWLGRRLNEGKKVYRDSFVYIPCLGASDAHVNVIRDVLGL